MLGALGLLALSALASNVHAATSSVDDPADRDGPWWLVPEPEDENLVLDEEANSLSVILPKALIPIGSKISVIPRRGGVSFDRDCLNLIWDGGPSTLDCGENPNLEPVEDIVGVVIEEVDPDHFRFVIIARSLEWPDILSSSFFNGWLIGFRSFAAPGSFDSVDVDLALDRENEVVNYWSVYFEQDSSPYAATAAHELLGARSEESPDGTLHVSMDTAGPPIDPISGPLAPTSLYKWVFFEPSAPPDRDLIEIRARRKSGEWHFQKAEGNHLDGFIEEFLGRVAAADLDFEAALEDLGLPESYSWYGCSQVEVETQKNYFWGTVDCTPTMPKVGAPVPPSGEWLSSAALPGFEAKVQVEPAGGEPIAARLETECIAETLCFSGALEGRPEVFLKVIGPRPNGFLWTQVARFTPSVVRIWLRQKATQALVFYQLSGVPFGSDELSGLQDRGAFTPEGETSSSRIGSPGIELVEGGDLVWLGASGGETGAPNPPPGDWLTTPELPGFRLKGRITPAGGMSTEAGAVSQCIAETLCLHGALEDRPEAFFKVIGPRPNGFLWVQIARFTPSKVEVWAEKTTTGEIQYYELDAVPSTTDNVSGLQDRGAFTP